jgi:hypothetical protein
MGGQAGGMVNEAGHFPEVCKKSVQAQAGDMHAGISEDVFSKMSIDDLGHLTPAEIERLERLVFPRLGFPPLRSGQVARHKPCAAANSPGSRICWQSDDIYSHERHCADHVLASSG